jgi:hypothetical protein
VAHLVAHLVADLAAVRPAAALADPGRPAGPERLARQGRGRQVPADPRPAVRVRPARMAGTVLRAVDRPAAGTWGPGRRRTGVAAARTGPGTAAAVSASVPFPAGPVASVACPEVPAAVSVACPEAPAAAAAPAGTAASAGTAAPGRAGAAAGRRPWGRRPLVSRAAERRASERPACSSRLASAARPMVPAARRAAAGRAAVPRAARRWSTPDPRVARAACPRSAFLRAVRLRAGCLRSAGFREGRQWPAARTSGRTSCLALAQPDSSGTCGSSRSRCPPLEFRVGERLARAKTSSAGRGKGGVPGGPAA